MEESAMKQKMLQNTAECGTIRSEKEAVPAEDLDLAYILSMSVEEKRELLEIWKRKVESE
jgi:hypothetical protein